MSIKIDFYPLQGGLDTMTPALMLDAGKCFDVQNYEPEITGGYRRKDGYERFDGQTSPSSANYWILPFTPTTNLPAIGTTITGMVSGATARVLAIELNQTNEIAPNYFVIGRLVGAFIANENITYTP